MQTNDIERVDAAVPQFRRLLDEAIEWHRERLRLLTEMHAACLQWVEKGTEGDPLEKAMAAAAGIDGRGDVDAAAKDDEAKGKRK